MLQALLLLGISSIMHFAYDFINHPIISLIAPINESIFQHIKILFYPISFYYLYKQKWNSFVFVQLVSIMMMLLIYYFYRYAFNIESVFIDILLLFVIFLLLPILNKIAISHHWVTSDVAAISFMIIMIFLLGYFTIYPLPFPIFIEGNPTS